MIRRSIACIAACALSTPVTPLAAKPVEQVRVGFSTSISGPFAALGAEARDGFNLAIKQLGGKLGGIPVEVFATDEAGNPDTARQHVDRYLKRDRIHFYTGPIGSNVALAVGPTLFAAEVFYLSNNAGPSQLAGAQCNAFFFGTAWQNDDYHEAAGKFASERGFRKVAVLAPNYPAGQDAVTGFKRGYAKPVASGDVHQARPARLRGRTGQAACAKPRRALHLSARRHGHQLHQAVRRRRTVDAAR